MTLVYATTYDNALTAQKLREIIDKTGMTMGSTGPGRDWCLKALHPSDPVATCSGIPDHTNAPTVLMNYQSTFTLAPRIGATGTWQFDSLLMPDPIALGWYTLTDSVGTTAGNFLNSQLIGANYNAKRISFLENNRVIRWRLAYLSVSAYQDGPTLSDQGTIAAAQYSVAPIHTQVSLTTGESPGESVTFGAPLAYFDANTMPDYTTLQGMPNSYFNQSKYGCYMPLHLVGDMDDSWASVSDLRFFAGALTGGGNGYVTARRADVPAPAAPYNSADPFWITTSGSGALMGTKICPPSNPLWGAMSARNLSVNTGYTFFIRSGWELEVTPTSPLASLQRVSPEYDPQAIEAYFRICRELKDAYPVEFNDLGKLWDVISKVARTYVAPLLPIMGPMGSGLKAGATAFMDVVDSFRKASKPSSGKVAPHVEQSLPAASVSRLRDAQAAAAAAPPAGRRPRRPRKKAPQGAKGQPKKGG